MPLRGLQEAMVKRPNAGAWVWERDPSTDECIFHEMPVDDLIEHALSEHCVCGPATFQDLDGITVVAHPSLDNREMYHAS